MSLPNVPAGLVSREHLRIGGGYDSPALGASPQGGLDIDHAGNLATNGDLTTDGVVDAAQFTNLHFTGTLQPAPGGCNKTWSHYIPATHMLTAAGGGAGMSFFHTSNVYLPRHSLDPDSNTYLGTSLALPQDYDGGTLRFDIFWSALAGTSGNVLWNLRTNSIGPGGDLEVGAGTGYKLNNDTFLGQKLLHVVSMIETPGGASQGDKFVSVLVGRRGTDASDTFDGPSLFLGLSVSFDY